MARLNLAGVHVKTSQDDRLADALRDLDEQRKRAQAAEEGEADANRDAGALRGDLISANREIDRLKKVVKVYEATALPRLDPDGELVSTGTVDALIGEALDMEIGGEK